MFYSQFGQDEYFSKLFPENYIGTCIEIGAYDGITGSNTLYFENKGWKCLCIEGNDDMYLKCKKIRSYSLNYCISNENNDDGIFMVYNLNGNNQSAISSLKPDERLIDSHSNLIQSSYSKNVKIRTLTKLLDEINFNQDIDIISIDTENTEIDVLNGIDFDKYNIKYLLIENNFNEDKCENFLLNKGFKKIHRIYVDDIYVNDNYNKKKIEKYFKIKSAHYHVFNKCDKYNSNVTSIVENSFDEYLNDNNKNILPVRNEIFEDRYPLHPKKLFLNYETILGERSNTIEEFKEFNWDKLLKELENEYLFYSNKNKNIQIGEVINMNIYNIVKNNSIDKITNVNMVDIKLKHIYELYDNYFNYLVYLNKKYIKSDNDYKLINFNDTSYANINRIINISRDVMHFKHKIERIINFFNNLIDKTFTESKENKSKNSVYLLIDNENEIFDKILEIILIFFEYDLVYINIQFKETIRQIFKNPNIIFTNPYFCGTKANTVIYLKYSCNEDTLSKTEKNIFDFKPITYICSGKLGDFLNSLSVINEKFRTTGRKGILYLANQNGGDNFKNSLEETYNELYEMVISQNYISEFKIYNDENYDINLNCWRDIIRVPTFDYRKFYTWKNIFDYTYHVDWAKHKWINNINYDELWSNKIIINMTTYRLASNIEKVNSILSENINNILFITFDEKEYEVFINQYKIKKDDVPIYKLSSLTELYVIINSCKYAYLGVSSFAVIANALHKQHSIFSCDDDFGNFTNNMAEILPHMLEFI